MSMSDVRQFETSQCPTWCPGCGDFAVWRALKLAFAEQKLSPHEINVVYGIGCAGNMADKLCVYGFHGLHGRALPTAAGLKLANHTMKVVVIAGDGDAYGEGMGHFIHGVHANHDLTYLVHNNGVYGLTKGQVAPTTAGIHASPVHPMGLALAAGATFVARAFSGHVHETAALITKAMHHRGLAFIDVLQPCTTYNHVNTYDFYHERVYYADKETGYAPTDRDWAQKKSQEWDEKIPLGILYANEDRPAYHETFPQLSSRPLVERPIDTADIAPLCKDFF